MHPLTILSTLPSAGVGALLALMPSTPSSHHRLIGVILLIGIVKKNAIMMIDFAIERERRRLTAPRRRSIYRAAPAALPPILMTTLAALFGAMPLAIWAAATVPSCANRSASPSSAACWSARC